MEREQLEAAKATIEKIEVNLCDTPTLEATIAAVEELAAIVGGLVQARLIAGEHAHAVSEMIKRGDDEIVFAGIPGQIGARLAHAEGMAPGEPRMTLAHEAEHMGSPTSGYPNTLPRLSEERIINACRKNVRDKAGIKTGLPCRLPIGHEGDCVPNVEADPRD